MSTALAFTLALASSNAQISNAMMAASPRRIAIGMVAGADPCMLPGDPSLVLHTNVRLADKSAFLRAASKAVAATTGKPESYVAVAVHDEAALLWDGSDAPGCIGCLYSIGSVSKEQNGALMVELAKLLQPKGVPADRTYVNFFDVPRQNVGWNGSTFAG